MKLGMAYHITLALIGCLFGLGLPLLWWSFLLSLSLSALTFACSLALVTGSRSLVALGRMRATMPTLTLSLTLAPSFPTAASATASATTASLSLLLCRILLRPRSPSDMAWGREMQILVG